MQFTPSEHKAKKNQLFTKEQGTEVAKCDFGAVVSILPST
jgi:hypothetical protein